MVIGESGFEARAGWITVSGYSGVCVEIRFLVRNPDYFTISLTVVEKGILKD